MVQKKMSPKNFGSRQILGQEKFWIQKNLGSKKFGYKIYQLKKLQSNKSFGPTNNFMHKTIFGPKNIFMSKNIFGPKYFGLEIKQW